jgi:hypothetical protein
MKDTVRFAASAAFWGDTPRAGAQVLRADGIDYLVSDYLAEITMALLARARAKDPTVGYVADAVQDLATLLPELHARGIKVITNAGALNPVGCAQALQAAADEAGLPLRVAAVEGDDLMPALEQMLAAQPRDMFTGEPVPAGVSSMNAYLGARPIARALDAGADIVITGRCVDAAVVLGPLMHEFGWRDDDHDLLAAGTLVGHIIECGPQCTGGIFTDWSAVPGWEEMGFPIADVHRDGSAVISKPPATGGLVSVGTVSEQIVYEIGDPGAYVMPDVVCDWRNVAVAQDGPDRVRVSGARGSAPTTSYKVTATFQDGYRAIATAMFAGWEAAGRARRTGNALVARTEQLLQEAGRAPLAEASVEVVGGGYMPGVDGAAVAGTEAVLKVGARHPDRAALEVFAQEFIPFGLVAQGMTGVFAGRPRVAPVFRVFHLLADKATTHVRVRLREETIAVAVAPGSPEPRTVTPTLPDPAPDANRPSGDTVAVPLVRLAWARSGDKGDRANIGVIARRPEYLPVIREQLTAARVAEFFAGFQPGDVRRWELSGLHAINVLIEEVLGGSGGTSTLRYDPQGKSYAAMLLTVPMLVPSSWGLAPAPIASESAG